MTYIVFLYFNCFTKLPSFSLSAFVFVWSLRKYSHAPHKDASVKDGPQLRYDDGPILL